MYHTLKLVQKTAEKIGRVEEVKMTPNWIPGQDQIVINGIDEYGNKYSLTLEVVRNDHDECRD